MFSFWSKSKEIVTDVVNESTDAIYDEFTISGEKESVQMKDDEILKEAFSDFSDLNLEGLC